MAEDRGAVSGLVTEPRRLPGRSKSLIRSSTGNGATSSATRTGTRSPTSISRRSRDGARRRIRSRVTRPGASPPISPSCRSCCASHRPLSTHFRYDLNSGHFAALRSLTSWANYRQSRRWIWPPEIGTSHGLIITGGRRSLINPQAINSRRGFGYTPFASWYVGWHLIAVFATVTDHAENIS